MPDDLAGLRAQREHGRSVEVVARPGLRRPWRRIADTPIGQVKLGIIGTGDPARSAAGLPGIAVLRPRLIALLAARRDCVSPPQLLAGLRVPPVDETANAEFGSRHSRKEHAVRHQRRHRHRIAFLPFGGLRFPKLLAGLGVIGNHMGVERRAKHLAVVERGSLIGDTAAHHTRRLRWPIERLLPELLSRADVDGDGVFCIGDVHDAVVDERLALLPPIIGEAQAPDRHKAFDVGLVDLLERAIALLAVAHSIGQHVAGILAVVLEVFVCLCGGCAGKQREGHSGRDCFHWTLPNLPTTGRVVRPYRMALHGQGRAVQPRICEA